MYIWLQGPLADKARSILKPSSLLELSCQDKSILDDDNAVAIRLPGTAGGSMLSITVKAKLSISQTSDKEIPINTSKI